MTTHQEKNENDRYEKALLEFEEERKKELKRIMPEEEKTRKEERNKGYLYNFVGIVCGGLIGIAIATILTLSSAKTPSGQYIKGEYCSNIDKECQSNCGPAQMEDCTYCCLEWSEKLEPISDILNGYIRLFGLIGVVVGFFIGNIRADSKIREVQRRRNELYPFIHGRNYYWDSQTGKIRKERL